MRRFRSGIFLLAALSGMPALVMAQTTATVTGVVADPTGAVISGVNVTLSNALTGVEFKSITNSAGSYHIANVPPGPGYKISITQSGFSPFSIENIYVNVANVTTQNATLNPGGEQVEITVNAAGQDATLNTENATIGNNIQVEKLNELPVQNRMNPSVLFTLQPGVTLNGSTTGSRTDQTNVTVDGLDVNDFGTGNFRSIVGNAPVDSVQEFRGTTAGFTSDSGPGGGGQFNLITRSGTNNWHGQASLYHRDNSTTANNWFNNLVGTRSPKLVQNQFGGSVGGPVKRDKLFFFFDATASRIAQQASTLRTVPLPSFLAGNISYINNNPGCTFRSRQNSTPNCISSLTPAQVKQKDPAGIGESPALFALLASRYPAANDLTAGDGINSGGFRFNADNSSNTTTYVGRVDYNLNSNIKLFGRGTVARQDAVNAVAQFPGDPSATEFVDRSYAYVAGMDWVLSTNKVNQFTYGSNVQDWTFAQPNNALGINQVTFATGVTTLFDDPYSSPSNAQARHIPISQIQDNFSWQLGRHALNLGGTFKWIHSSESTILDYNSYTLGLGGEVQGLTASLRPGNLLTPSATAQVTYDSAFAAALGRVGAINTKVDFDASGNALPQATGSKRNYQYYQTLAYVGDTWKVTPHLTLSYGVNYQYFSVPYEKNGLETVQTTGFDEYMTARVKQSSAGLSGPNSVPFITYLLGGPKNNGPGFYHPDVKNFGPRFAFSYNPGFDPKTVFNGSFGIVYDRTVVSAVQYQQDQFSYLFQQSFTQNYGDGTNPTGSLATDARFDAPPAPPAVTTPKAPYQPYVDAAGLPGGLQNGGAFNAMIDPHLKTPYNMLINFGFQHEFPSSTVVRINYVGRLGRRLLAQADASQLVEFPDPASGQLMSNAMGNITKELRAGADPTNLPAEPWFENQVVPGFGAGNGYPNNTSLIADALQGLVIKGDFADTIQQLSGLLDYNVGMGAQFSENTVYTNKGFSSYNGLLVSVQKNLSHGLAFDANYTFSHAIDNVSLIANGVAFGGYGFICDALRPRLCRGNSDFDTTHYFNSFFTYSLPFGRGRTFGSHIPWGLDEIIGGWDISGIPSWHSGNAFSTVSSAFVAGYANNAPAIFNGDKHAIRNKTHKTADGLLYQFADPEAALAAFQGPIGFQIGSRNNLRGPQYFNFDAGLAKTFSIIPDWGLKVLFRADAFNALNHPNFSTPGNNSDYDDITKGSNFGQLSTMNAGVANQAYRVLQLSARVQF